VTDDEDAAKLAAVTWMRANRGSTARLEPVLHLMGTAMSTRYVPLPGQLGMTQTAVRHRNHRITWHPAPAARELAS
jgi:hypothetical protein